MRAVGARPSLALRVATACRRHCAVRTFRCAPWKERRRRHDGATLENFCGQISVLLDRKVIDRTGIAGKFDIQVEMQPLSDDPPADGVPGPPAAQDSAKSRRMETAIFAAVAKMGLKLEAGKGQREIPVIDHAERPVEN